MSVRTYRSRDLPDLDWRAHVGGNAEIVLVDLEPLMEERSFPRMSVQVIRVVCLALKSWW